MVRVRKNAPETVDNTSKVEPAKGRQHVATYTRIRSEPMKWFIRIEGPNAEKFSGRKVPVATKNGVETDEDLTRLIWSGQDKRTGGNVGIYEFVAKPRGEEELDDEIPF